MKLCGIYKIISKTNGKSYFGSTNDFERRVHKHKCLLRKNIHDNKHLQNAWNKYGEENFEWKFVEKCEITVLLQREQYYLDEAKTNKHLYYNINFVANKPPSPLGRKWKDSSKRKFSIIKMGNGNSMFGKLHTDFTRKKMTESHVKTDHYFISPQNEIVNIRNLKKFCRDNKLNEGGMYGVFKGRLIQYKGWKKMSFEKPTPIYN